MDGAGAGWHATLPGVVLVLLLFPLNVSCVNRCIDWNSIQFEKASGLNGLYHHIVSVDLSPSPLQSKSSKISQNIRRLR